MLKQRKEISKTFFDLNSNIGIGIEVPLNKDYLFKTTFFTKDKIKNNLLNLLLTEPGDRPFNPTLGIGFKNLLFEPNISNNLDEIEENISKQINNYIPELIINELKLIPEEDNYKLTIFINYSYNNIKDNLVINFT